jgi:atypical dual specificity phosphatase
MSEIIKNKLYLGNLFDVNNSHFIKDNNITCIICVAEGLKIKNENDNIKIYKYDLQDDYNCDISLYLHEIVKIINMEKVVLVNCVAGISRSSTFVIAYLIKYFNISLKKAFLYVKSKRNQICPNKKFMESLIEYELKILGKNSLTYDECINLFYYT